MLHRIILITVSSSETSKVYHYLIFPNFYWEFNCYGMHFPTNLAQNVLLAGSHSSIPSATIKHDDVVIKLAACSLNDLPKWEPHALHILGSAHALII